MPGSLGGSQIQSVAMGWQVYAISRRTLDVAHSAFNVSLVGLFTFVPLLLLSLPGRARRSTAATAGELVRLPCYVVEIRGELPSWLWRALVWGRAGLPRSCQAVAVLFGAALAPLLPAMMVLAPTPVPRELLPKVGSPWYSLAWQTASIGGPAMAGLLIIISPGVAYGAGLFVFYFAAASSVLLLIRARNHGLGSSQSETRLELVREGLVYAWVRTRWCRVPSPWTWRL